MESRKHKVKVVLADGNRFESIIEALGPAEALTQAMLELKEEFKELDKKHKIHNLSNYFKEEFFETKKVVYIPN